MSSEKHQLWDLTTDATNGYLRFCYKRYMYHVLELSYI